jgi:hypothetical protein
LYKAVPFSVEKAIAMIAPEDITIAARRSLNFTEKLSLRFYSYPAIEGSEFSSVASRDPA